MKRKFGIVASCLRNGPQIESLEKIKAAGFDGFLPASVTWRSAAPCERKQIA